MAYDDTFRQDILAILDEVQTDLVADGLLMRESNVRLASTTYTGADQALGEPGTASTTYVTITPRPRVDLRDQYRNRDGQTVHVGVGKLIITKSVARDDILGASWVEVGGEKYTVREGDLKDFPLHWIAILQRWQQ